MRRLVVCARRQRLRAPWMRLTLVGLSTWALAMGAGGGSATAAALTSGAVAPDEAVQLSPNDMTNEYTLNGIACVTAASCWAVGSTAGPGSGDPYGEGIVVQVNDGVPGTVTPVPGTSELSGISCFTVNLGDDCNAVGTNLQSVSGGVLVSMDVSPGNPNAPQFLSTTPADQVSGTTDLGSISCPSSSTCVAVGANNGLLTNNGYGAGPGSNGVIVPIANMDPSHGNLPFPGTTIEETGTNYLSGVSCPTNSSCVTVGVAGPNDVVIPVTKGLAGNVEPVTPGDAFTGVACPSTNTCYGVDIGGSGNGTNFQGEVVPIKNGRPGTPVIDSGVAFDGIACISSTATCVGTGFGEVSSAVAVPIQNGVPGSTAAVPNDSQPSVNGGASGPGSLNGVDCPSTAQCFSVGTAETSGPSHYSPPYFTAWLDTMQVTSPS